MSWFSRILRRKREGLYAARYLTDESAAAVARWARQAGLSELVEPTDLHATTAWSRVPVDQSQLSRTVDFIEVEPGPRLVKRLGAEGAIVLAFDSWALREDWKRLRSAGASWDYPSYQPHVTVAFDGPADLSAIRPYDGPLVFGPERLKVTEV